MNRFISLGRSTELLYPVLVKMALENGRVNETFHIMGGNHLQAPIAAPGIA